MRKLGSNECDSARSKRNQQEMILQEENDWISIKGDKVMVDMSGGYRKPVDQERNGDVFETSSRYRQDVDRDYTSNTSCVVRILLLNRIEHTQHNKVMYGFSRY
jgi:hypothetical protein